MLCLSAKAASEDSVVVERRLSSVEVVGASSANKTASTAPLRVVSSDDVLRFGITDVADALHRMAGITLRDYGGAGGMKTVSVRGLGSKHTGVSYDGITLSECQSGEIDLSRYSIDNVESLALTIGDNADIFIPARQAAYPALISIRTLHQPAENARPELLAQLRAGSFGYVSPFLRYAQNVSDKLSLSLSGEYIYAENYYPYTLKNGLQEERKRRTNSMMNSYRGEIGFAWKSKSERQRLEGKLYYYDNDRELPGIARYYTDISLERLHDRNAFAQLVYNIRCGSMVSLKWLGKFNFAASDYRNGAYADGINDAEYWQREAYSALCVLVQPLKNVAFDYSVDYSYNNLNSSLATDTRPFRHTLLQSATAKYASRRLTAMLRLLHSLYFNDAKDGDGARDMRRLSPSLSLSYRLLRQEELYARASLKNIFRAPTFNESYFFHYGSTDLLPESTNQANVGLSWRHSFAPLSSLQINVDGYLNSVKDMIVAVPMNMFVWRTINVGRVKSHGIETAIEVHHAFTDRLKLSFSGSYTWQRCENKTNSESQYYGNQIAYTPEHTFSAALGVEHPWLSVAANAYGVSRRYTTNEHYDGTCVSGYAEFGLSVYRHFRLWRGLLGARIDIKNLLDKQYFVVAKYPMPGRSWQITLNYKL